MANKILIITSYFAPAWSYGGPPKVLYLLAKELVRYGKEVTVVTTDVLDEKRNLKLSQIMDGVRVVRFKTISNYLAYKAKIFFVPNLLTKAKEYIDQSEVVLFSDLRTMINWSLYPYINRKKIPYGIFPFGQIPLGSGFYALAKKLFDFWWVNNFVKKANWCFFQTKHEQELLLNHYRLSANKVQFFPLPVEKKLVETDNRLLGEFKRKWSIQLNDQVLLFVGRLHYLKGIDILIKAVKPLLRIDKHLKLMIVGRDDGEEYKLKKSVAQDINKQIIFTGPLYDKEVAKAYLTATCFVFTPRFYEETSLACLEALSYGKPVVVTKQADIPCLEEYNAGLVVGNKIKAIQEAIENILRIIKNSNNKMSEHALRLNNDHYDPKKIARELIKNIDVAQK